jgi:hypothetical protein
MSLQVHQNVVVTIQEFPPSQIVPRNLCRTGYLQKEHTQGIGGFQLEGSLSTNCEKDLKREFEKDPRQMKIELYLDAQFATRRPAARCCVAEE